MAPIVRTYQRQIEPAIAPDVERRGYAVPQLETPPPRVTPGADANGAQFGATVASEGEQLLKEEKVKQDQIRLLDADTQAGQLENQLMYDPQAGALNVKGKAAFALPDQVGQAWDSGVDKIRQGLANSEQRIAFDQHVSAVRNRMMQALGQHIAGESYRVDSESLSGKVQNETEAAIADGQPQRIQQAVNSVTVAYQDYGNRYGIPQDQTEAATVQAVSRIHEGVIRRMLDNGNDIQAKVYYEHAQDQVLPSQRGNVERALLKGTDLGDSQRIADTIKQQMPTAPLTQMMDEISKYTDKPEVRKLAEEQLRSYSVAKREETRQAQEDASKQAKVQMDALELQIKNTMDRAPRAMTYEQVVPQSVRDVLPEPVEKAQREYWKQITEKGKVETDLGLYYNLLSLSSSETTKDDFARTNLMQYVNRLDQADFKTLANVQAAIRKGDDKTADQLLGGYRTVDETIRDRMLELGLDPTPKPGTDEAKRLGLLRRTVDQQMAEQGVTRDKPDYRQRVQSIIDGLTIKGTTQVPGWIWGTNPSEQMNIDVPADKPFALDIKQVPADERRKITDALTRAQVPVTDTAIINMYMQKIRGGRK